MGDFEAVQKPRSCVLSGLKTRLRLEFLNLIIHSGSFFKQNIKTVQLILWMKLSPEILIHVEI